jgi:outer membrane protein OmpA-like peptidoglycan-associated protein
MSYFSSDIEIAPEDEQDSSVLLSIGDLMSGLLMLFILLFVVVMGQLIERPVVKSLVDTLQQQLAAKKIDVVVNPKTGDVSVSESILFSEGSSDLTSAGKSFLRKFVPTYSEVIFSKSQFDDEIIRVVIEGHTSSKGTDQNNMALSLRRSLSVSNYITSNSFRFNKKASFVQKILVSGRGETDANRSKDVPGDRKVTFRFQLRGDNFSQLNRKP